MKKQLISILIRTAFSIISILILAGCTPVSYANLAPDIIQDYKKAKLLYPNKNLLIPEINDPVFILSQDEERMLIEPRPGYTENKDILFESGLWKKEVCLSNKIKVNVMYNPGPQGDLRLRYSDERSDKQIWKYFDYFWIDEIRISDNYILFYTVDGISPSFSNGDKIRYLHSYNLISRKRIGHIKM